MSPLLPICSPKNFFSDLTNCHPGLKETLKLALNGILTKSLADGRKHCLRKLESSASLSLTTIPNEILLEILKYIPSHQLRSISTLCKSLACAAADDSLWRHYMKSDFPGCSIQQNLAVKEQYKKAEEARVLSNIENGRYLEEMLPISCCTDVVIHGDLIFVNKPEGRTIEILKMNAENCPETCQILELPTAPRGQLFESTVCDGVYLFIDLVDDTIQVRKKNTQGLFSALTTLTNFSRPKYHQKQNSTKRIAFIDNLLISVETNSRSVKMWSKDEKDAFTLLEGSSSKQSLRPSELKSDGKLLFVKTRESLLQIWKKKETNEFTLLHPPLAEEAAVSSFPIKTDNCFFKANRIFQTFPGGGFKIWEENDQKSFTLQQEVPGREFSSIKIKALECHPPYIFTALNINEILVWKWGKDNKLALCATLRVTSSLNYISFYRNRLFIVCDRHSCEANKEKIGIHALNFGASFDEMLAELARTFIYKNPGTLIQISSNDWYKQHLPQLLYDKINSTHVTFSTHVSRFQAMPQAMVDSIEAILKEIPENLKSANRARFNEYYLAIMHYLILHLRTLKDKFRLLEIAFTQTNTDDPQVFNIQLHLFKLLYNQLSEKQHALMKEWQAKKPLLTPKDYAELCKELVLRFKSF